MKRIAILITRILTTLLHLINRGGSLPGQIALKLCPSIIEKLHIECPIILVTGTNGKTSTANMISETLEHAGKHVISNRKGDNLRSGITTTLLSHAALSGKVNAEAIVLEVDELNLPYIIKSVKADALVVTNFFRDQLDRAREMEQLIQKLEGAIHNYEGTLILNGNDPNVVRLSYAAPHATEVYYGLQRCESSVITTDEASEGKFCPRCGARLQYAYYQYSHIGEFYCKDCDFKTPPIDVWGTVTSIRERTFTFKDTSFHAPQGGLYTMYNCMAVLAITQVFGIALHYAEQTFHEFKVPDGRNETFLYHDHSCTLNLIKNPTGANEVMKVIEEDEQEKCILIILNDNDQDGRDISWIYDTFFEKLINTKTTCIITSGSRCYDMALRLKYGGYEGDLTIKETLEEAVEALTKSEKTMYVIATYTALQPVRNLLVTTFKGGIA